MSNPPYLAPHLRAELTAHLAEIACELLAEYVAKHHDEIVRDGLFDEASDDECRALAPAVDLALADVTGRLARDFVSRDGVAKKIAEAIVAGGREFSAEMRRYSREFHLGKAVTT